MSELNINIKIHISLQCAIKNIHLSATKNWFYRNLSQQWCLSKQRPNAKIAGGQVDSRW